MEVRSDGVIVLARDCSWLDLFVLRFVQVLEKYVGYALISGYVAILFGRSPSTC